MKLKVNIGPGLEEKKINRQDKTIVFILTVCYLLLTLLNLGTLSFPEKEFTFSNEPVLIDLGKTENIASIWFNGNIGTGDLLFTDDNHSEFNYSQTFGEMFSWRSKPVSFNTRYISVVCTGGNVSLNEIAFFDSDGNLLPARSLGNHSSCGLLDEQDTVPKTISYMNGMYFDEIYHARTAYEYIHGMSVYEWTHPPLGKLLIAVGILIFGMKPFGWRFIPAVLGAAMLPVIYCLAKRFTKRTDYSFLAAALFSVDTMHFAQTRIATVDVFVVFFILLMYLFMYDYLSMDYMEGKLSALFFPLGACGVCFGLGTASKWTGLYAGVGLALLFFANIAITGIRVRGDSVQRRIFVQRTIKTLLFCCVFFLMIPACIYFLAYVPFYRYEASCSSHYGIRDALRALIQQQKSMYSYHSGLTATHLCQSFWYQWPFSAKSVWFYFNSAGGKISNISSMGNAAVWWISAIGFLILIIEFAFGMWRKKDNEDRLSGFVLIAAAAANFLPWITVSRCVFLYHYFPTLPFVILSAVFLMSEWEKNSIISSWVKWIWLLFSFIFFILLYPAASGIPVPRVYAYFLEYILPTGNIFMGAI